MSAINPLVANSHQSAYPSFVVGSTRMTSTRRNSPSLFLLLKNHHGGDQEEQRRRCSQAVHCSASWDSRKY
ncbi:hypothetical protein I7I53_08846 [Histoplasma capsulatum var. duboisii H88]|uniref:Uncharacterized protein n=1 Tax=Ajellomyces capsulatus (strain H88) TaxID=544711 RepID=A0A8A1L555_AJEC8|nr:hypothetical protein I7I53_08846 [Histoplasma capsulatum var. duboisii H88]